MTQITELTEKAKALVVPAEAIRFEMEHWATGDTVMIYMPDNGEGGPNYYEQLFLTGYSILGRPEELTSNQWYGIVPGDYPKKKGIELLKSKSLEGASIIILIKQ